MDYVAMGRRPHEMRRLVIRLGPFAWSSSGFLGYGSSDGAALVVLGNTKVLCTVIGPREVIRHHQTAQISQQDNAQIICEFNVAPFSGNQRKIISKSDRRNIEASLLIKQTFESVILISLYPSSQIHIIVQVLTADGATLACALNAATLALQNAGIAMRDMVCASTSGFIDSTTLLDLNHSERSSDTPELTLAILPNSQKIILIQEENKVSLTNLPDMINMAKTGCMDIANNIKKETKQFSENMLHARGSLNG